MNGLNAGTKVNDKVWFIEEVSAWDMTSTKACLHLTNYKLPIHKEIEKGMDREISKLRWVSISKASVGLGFASGRMTVDGKEFDLTYAWAGLNSKENYHIRESYAVMVKGKNCGRFFTNLAKRINKIEGEAHCMGNLIGLFPFMKRVRPYRLKCDEEK